MEMCRNRMMAAVADADGGHRQPDPHRRRHQVRAPARAPRVVAKGRGPIADRIREEAERHNVPIVRDVALARTLETACELGPRDPAELYEAVARLLAFVMRVSRAGRRTGPGPGQPPR